jgi:hypothetical protein
VVEDGEGFWDDNGDDECFAVTPVTPARPTTAGPAVVLGNPVTYTAALSSTSNQPGAPAINPTTAGAKAGGTISFTLLKDDCSTDGNETVKVTDEAGLRLPRLLRTKRPARRRSADGAGRNTYRGFQSLDQADR